MGMKLRLPNGAVLEDVSEEFALKLMGEGYESNEKEEAEPVLAERLNIEADAKQERLNNFLPKLNKEKQRFKVSRKESRRLHIDMIPGLAHAVLMHKNANITEFIKKSRVIKKKVTTQNVAIAREVLFRYLKLFRGVSLGKYAQTIKSKHHEKKGAQLKVYNGRNKRMAFIQAFRRKLMQEDATLNYEKTFKRAAEEYNNRFFKKNNGNKHPVNGILKILDDAAKNEILNGMLYNVTRSKGSLTFEPDAGVLGLPYQEWKNLLMKILSLNRDVNDHFSASGTFHLKWFDGRAGLSYY